MSGFNRWGRLLVALLATGLFGIAQERSVEIVDQTNSDLQTATLVWATDEAWIAAFGAQDGVVRVYDVASGRMSRQITVPNASMTSSKFAVPSRTEIAVSSGMSYGYIAGVNSGSIDIYDVISGAKVITAAESGGCNIRAVDRTEIKGYCLEKTKSMLHPYAASLKFWDVETGRLLRTEAGTVDSGSEVHDGVWTARIRMVSAGKQMFTALRHAGNSAALAMSMYRFEIADSSGSQILMQGEGNVLALSQKAHTAVLLTAEGVFLTDVPSGRRVATLGPGLLNVTDRRLYTKAISAAHTVLGGSEYLLTGYGESSLIDASTGAIQSKFELAAGGVVSPGGDRVACPQGTAILLVSLPDTTKRQVLGNQAAAAAPAPDVSKLYGSALGNEQAESKKAARQQAKDDLHNEREFEKTLPKFNAEKRAQMEEDHHRERQRQAEARNRDTDVTNPAVRKYAAELWNSYKRFGGPALAPPDVEFLDAGRTMAVVAADLSWNAWDVATGNHLPARTIAMDYMKLFELSANKGDRADSTGVIDRYMRKELASAVSSSQALADAPSPPAAMNVRACSSRSLDYLLDITPKLDPKAWKSGKHVLASAILRSSDGTSVELTGKNIDFSSLTNTESYSFGPAGEHCALSDDGKLLVIEKQGAASEKRTRSMLRQNAMRGLQAKHASAGLMLYETTSGRQVCELGDSVDAEAGEVVFSPRQRYIATSAGLWDAKSCVKLGSGAGYSGMPAGFSSDERLLYTATDRNDAGQSYGIQAIEVATGRVLKALPDVNANPNLINTTANGRILLGADRDNALGFWDLETGARLASLRALQEGEWLVTTPSGYFDGSPRGWTQIAWRIPGQGLATQPGEIFFNEFYRPGLLAEVLQGRVPKGPRNIDQVDRRQPSVHISASEAKVAVREAAIRITVEEARPDSQRTEPGGVRDVRLFRNGTLVKVWRGEAKLQSGKATLETVAPLESGRNEFVAYAFNRDNVKSGDASVTVESTAAKLPGTTYILTVGINQYSNPEFNLKFAAPDAETFAVRVSESQKKMDASRKLVEVKLLDREAVRANIMLALALLAGEHRAALPPSAPKQLAQLKAAQPEDTVIIYFAGHGVAWGDRFYVVPHDLGYSGARENLKPSLETLLKSSISDQDLENAFEPMQASRSLLIIDACNSGKVLDSDEQRRGPMNNRGLAQLAYEKGMYVLTAAQSYQAALESSRLGHGYLTYALAEEGLTTPEADKQPADGRITAAEWFEYAARRVPELQAEAIKHAAEAGRQLTFDEAPPGDASKDSGRLQTPRVYYRRELSGSDTVVAVLK